MAAEESLEGRDEAFLAELRAAREDGRRAPDFFVVGHAKCGTTALCQMLAEHPRIFMPIYKETQFLSRGPRLLAEYAKKREPRRPQTLEAYLSLFEQAAPQLCAGEGSTEYLRTFAAAANVFELCPRGRIVAAFREPASFLRSLHLQLLEVGVETEQDFERAMALEQPRREGKKIPRDCPWPPALMYSQHVRYVEQLRRWQELFGRERVLVLIYDDFRADNEAVLRDVLRFLEVDDTVAIAPVEANPTVRVRSRRTGDAATALALGRGPLAGAAKTLIKAISSERMRRAALGAVRRAAVDAAPAPTDEELMAALRARFHGEVRALGEHLNRDLISLWGYNDDRLA
jgi:Sulfotransferase family